MTLSTSDAQNGQRKERKSLHTPTAAQLASMKELEDKKLKQSLEAAARARSGSAPPPVFGGRRSMSLKHSGGISQLPGSKQQFKDVTSKLHKPTASFENSTWKNVEKSINSMRKSVNQLESSISEGDLLSVGPNTGNGEHIPPQRPKSALHQNHKPTWGLPSTNVVKTQVLPGSKSSRFENVSSKLYKPTVAYEHSTWRIRPEQHSKYSLDQLKKLGIELEGFSEVDFQSHGSNTQLETTTLTSRSGGSDKLSMTTPDANIRQSLLLPTESFLSSMRVLEDKKRNPQISESEDPWWELRGPRNPGKSPHEDHTQRSYSDYELSEVINRLVRPTVATKNAKWEKRASSRPTTPKTVSPSEGSSNELPKRRHTIFELNERLTRPTVASKNAQWDAENHCPVADLINSHHTPTSQSRPSSGKSVGTKDSGWISASDALNGQGSGATVRTPRQGSRSAGATRR